MKPLAEILRTWEAVIGLEVHTELTACKTKMFCNCRVSHDDEPNANVCPVCLGMPGALAVPNEEAIRMTVMAGLATGCDIMPRSMFYRKHYFYPDLGKNYQITQGPVAFCMHGQLNLEVSGRAAAERGEEGAYVTPIRIQRIHLEEDAAKMVHVGGKEGRIDGSSESLIDYNRNGTPLIELVTEPDLRTPEEARLFMEKLRETFLALGISDCSMENGAMRCDGNISLRRRGDEGFGTKTELKNINSFKHLHDALEYEIRRQATLLEAGGAVSQETRHWEPRERRTVVMRMKETTDDYRFFPDPDLAPFNLSPEFVEECRSRMPELPDAKRARYVAEYGLGRSTASRIAGKPVAVALFEEASSDADPDLARSVASVIVNLLPASLSVSAAQVRSLAELLAGDAITNAQAREVLETVAGTDDDPMSVVDAKGLRQSTDTAELEPVVDAVLARCESQVAQYRAGNTKVLAYLLGQCMRAAKGSGNPKLFTRLLEDRLAYG